jgi:hypothetical protein
MSVESENPSEIQFFSESEMPDGAERSRDTMDDEV